MASGVVQLQRLQDGAGQKTDALILQGTDGQALNNLTSAPHAICSIGQILCVAAKKDFDLRGDGKDAKPKLVEHPESFRATLVQVARESHGAFQKAHESMLQLGLQMGEVPEHLKQTVKLLLNKDQMPVRQMGKHVQIQLESVEKVGETCLELAESTHAKFDGVMQLLWETQMLLTAKKGATEKEKEDIASKQKAASMSLEAMKGSKTKLEEEFGKLDKEATEAREDMKKIMDSKPSGGDLIGAAFAEAGCALIQSLGQAAGQAAVMYAGGGAGAAAQGLGALGKADAKAAPAPSGATAGAAAGATAPAVSPEAAANSEFAPQVDMLMGAVSGLSGALSSELTQEAGQQMAKQLETVKGVISKVLEKAHANSGGLAKDAVQLGQSMLDPLEQATAALKSGDAAACSKLKEKVGNLSLKAQEIVVKKAAVLPSLLPPAQPCQQQGQPAAAPTGSIGATMTETWKFQTAAAKELLKEANRRRDEELERLRGLNEKMLSENLKLSQLKLEDLNIDQIMQVLRQAIVQIGCCQEAWSRLVQYFIYINELTKFCCKKQLPDFVKYASQISQDVQQGDAFGKCLRDQMYQMVVRTSQTAYTAQHLAEVYHRISEQHFLEPLASVSKIAGMDPGPELDKLRQGLIEQCGRATGAVKKAIEQQKTETKKQIEDRIRRIETEMEAHFGQAPPAVQNVVVKAVEDVRKGGGYSAPPAVAIDLNEDDLI